jgi:hypothetical protein
MSKHDYPINAGFFLLDVTIGMLLSSFLILLSYSTLKSQFQLFRVKQQELKSFTFQRDLEYYLLSSYQQSSIHPSIHLTWRFENSSFLPTTLSNKAKSFDKNSCILLFAIPSRNLLFQDSGSQNSNTWCRKVKDSNTGTTSANDTFYHAILSFHHVYLQQSNFAVSKIPDCSSQKRVSFSGTSIFSQVEHETPRVAWSLSDISLIGRDEKNSLRRVSLRTSEIQPILHSLQTFECSHSNIIHTQMLTSPFEKEIIANFDLPTDPAFLVADAIPRF